MLGILILLYLVYWALLRSSLGNSVSGCFFLLARYCDVVKIFKLYERFLSILFYRIFFTDISFCNIFGL